MDNRRFISQQELSSVLNSKENLSQETLRACEINDEEKILLMESLEKNRKLFKEAEEE